MIETKQGANAYIHSLDHALEFFSKAGSLYTNKQSYYGEEATALDLFVNTWIVDKPLSFALLLWLRDCRGGAGNRSGARSIYKWLAENDAEWIKANIHQLPEVGRWDDLRSLFNTSVEEVASGLWADAIDNNEVLAAKWADRSDHPIRNSLDLSVPEFRKVLANVRKNHIVEHLMCQKHWDRINYEQVPSVAMSRYTKAFYKNDEDRFKVFKTQVATGEKTIKASVLFPHDCVRTALNGDREIADAQFEALPNFFGDDSDERIMVLSDTSGSMGSVIGGSITCYDVSVALALYCSAKMSKDSPFYKRFIAFCSEGSFKEWRGMSFSEAVNSRGRGFHREREALFDGAVGSTRVDLAMNTILEKAVRNNISQDLMPTCLLIVSDMQFHNGGSKTSDTEIERCLKEWNEAGYESPKVVYWNLAGYANQQATKDMKNVGMVSGFSPALLQSVLGGTDFSPIGIMLRTLEKYVVVAPEEV
jgi:hypothetical protein